MTRNSSQLSVQQFSGIYRNCYKYRSMVCCWSKCICSWRHLLGNPWYSLWDCMIQRSFHTDVYYSDHPTRLDSLSTGAPATSESKLLLSFWSLFRFFFSFFFCVCMRIEHRKSGTSFHNVFLYMGDNSKFCTLLFWCE